MELLKNDSVSIDVRLSIDELLTFHESLNEVCNGLHLNNFQERIGVTRKEAIDLMHEISGIYHEIEKPPEEYYY